MCLSYNRLHFLTPTAQTGPCFFLCRCHCSMQLKDHYSGVHYQVMLVWDLALSLLTYLTHWPSFIFWWFHLSVWVDHTHQYPATPICCKSLKGRQIYSSSLLQDLQHTGLAGDLVTIEIGCLDHFMPEAISWVAKACQAAKKFVWALFEQGTRTAVSCSYTEF